MHKDTRSTNVHHTFADSVVSKDVVVKFCNTTVVMHHHTGCTYATKYAAAMPKVLLAKLAAATVNKNYSIFWRETCVWGVKLWFGFVSRVVPTVV